MTIETRPAREDEMQLVHDVTSMAFNGERGEKGREHMMQVESIAPARVALEDGSICAALRVYNLTTRVNGALIGMGGVSSVACYPEHRRRGFAGRLLTDALAAMRDNGQPLSALFTPHPGLYRRYGWGVASASMKYSVHPKSVKPYGNPKTTGQAFRVTEDEWEMLAPVYEASAVGKTGLLTRDEHWWRQGLFRMIYDEKRALMDVAAWRDSSGQTTGYIVHRSFRAESSPGNERNLTWVREFVALDGDAYVGLLRYLLSHDLSHEAYWFGPVDEPFAYALDDSYRVSRELHDDPMIRVVEVERAIAERPAAMGAPDGAFTLAITDRVCPWNDGTWRIECDGGRLSATKTAGDADVSMEAATFGAVYYGYMRTSEAVRCGIAQGANREAMALADRVLASDYAPRISDFF